MKTTTGHIVTAIQDGDLQKLIIAFNDITADVNYICEQGLNPSESLMMVQDELWNALITQLELDYSFDHEVICNALQDLGVAMHSDPRLDPRDSMQMYDDGSMLKNCPF
jgi:hypothetical protein